MPDKTPQKNPEINWEESIKVVLEMVKDGDSWYTKHQPLTERDFERLMELPTSGMTQVAHSLLLEAVKREVYLSYFSMQTKEGLDTRVLQVLTEILKREIPNVVKNLNLRDRQ